MERSGAAARSPGSKDDAGCRHPGRATRSRLSRFRAGRELRSLPQQASPPASRRRECSPASTWSFSFSSRFQDAGRGGAIPRTVAKIGIDADNKRSRGARLHLRYLPRLIDRRPARVSDHCKGFANAGHAAPAACRNPVSRHLETRAAACKTSLHRGRFVEGTVPVVAPPPLARSLVVSEPVVSESLVGAVIFGLADTDAARLRRLPSVGQ